MTDDLWNEAAAGEPVEGELLEVEYGKRPVPKVAAAGVSGALAVVVVYVAAALGLDMPAEVGASIAALVAFVAGYLKRG